MDERDLLGAPSNADGSMTHPVLEWGTVGWPSDNTQVDYGAADNDGMTLVKVTLYRGRKPGTGRALQPGVADGIPVVAHVDARLFQALPIGARIVVGFPGGDILTPGNGIILAVAGKSPTSGFDASTMTLPVPDGSTINIGDATADFVALAAKVLEAIQDLQKAFKPPPAGLWTPTPNDGGLALQTAITAAGEFASKTYDFATKKLKGT